MFKPFFLYIGSRYTNLRQRDHFITFISMVSMIGIALGVMVLITVLSVMNGFTKEIRSRILSVTPHIMITEGRGEPLKDWHMAIDYFMQDKQVEAAGPFIEGQGMITRGRDVRGVMVKGIEPETVDAVFPLRTTLLSGKVEDLQPGSFGVILGGHLAKLLGVDVGDSITLIIPEVTVSLAGVTPRMKRLKVVGVFEVGYIYDSTHIFLHLEDSARLFKTGDGVTGVQLRLTDPFNAPRLASKFRMNSQNAYHVVDWTVLNSAYFSAVKMEKTMMFFTLIMILAIAVFNLISTLVMVVTDKRGDIAVFRVLGASRRKIMAIFIAQGAIIGLMGTLLGVIAGVLLALNVTDLVTFIEKVFETKFLSAEVYFINFLPSDLQMSDVLLVTACAMGLSLLATIHPAWRASKVEPAEALRHDA
jgi:lipoprotein-releasing system permease protein